MQQWQVQARDAQRVQQYRPGDKSDQHGQGLDLGNLSQALLDRIDHFVAHGLDVFQRATAAHRVVELVVELDEIRLDAHQEHGHAGDDGQVGQEHRQVVDDGCAQAADDGVRRGREVPEHELVDPHAQVVEQADGHECGVQHGAACKVKGDDGPRRIELAHHQQPHAHQQHVVAQHKAAQQPLQPPGAHQQRAHHDESVGHAKQQHDGLVALHARQQHRQHPYAAHEGKAGQHQQPVHQPQARQRDEECRRAQHAGPQQHQHQQAVQIGQHHVLALFKQAVGDEAGERQLHQAGVDQAAGHQVGHRGLELRDQASRDDHAGAEDTDQQDAHDGKHPGPGADDAGVGIGLYEA